MNEQIRKSMDYVNAIYRYDIDESTVAILNEEREYWVAKATTTHLKKRGEQEITLVVFVQMGYDVTVISPDVVPSLSHWFSQHYPIIEEK